mmetsp:Transcript_17436/g.37787  ORF Transcript_17436/g.37787 Transcript_17436/m.37787 type:complete len:108 (-) Transcript_17436:127-450(-)
MCCSPFMSRMKKDVITSHQNLLLTTSTDTFALASSSTFEHAWQHILVRGSPYHDLLATSTLHALNHDVEDTSSRHRYPKGQYQKAKSKSHGLGQTAPASNGKMNVAW